MITYIFLLLLLPLGCSYLFGTYKKIILKPIYCASSILLSNLILNSISLCIEGKSIINFTSFDANFIFLYALGVIACCGLWDWLYVRISKQNFYIYKKTTLLFAICLMCMYVYFSWLLGESGRQTFELFIYNLIMPVNTGVADFQLQLCALLFFMIVMSVAVGILIMKWPFLYAMPWKKRKSFRKRQRITAILPSVICFCIILYYPIYAFHLEDAYPYFFSDNHFIEENYINPNDVTFTWPTQKQNLVFIFMESFESSYFAKEQGGLNEENLLPNLANLMNEGISFSNHAEGIFGGAHTMPQATVTMAGMATTFSGVNYKVPVAFANDELATLPHMTTLNDLLAQQGYKTYFMGGYEKDAYQIGPFYRAHGNTETIGWQDKIASKELPEDYKVWWGFEDKKLYEFAQQDLSELATQEEPFFYTLSTNDTHRREGYTDPSCPTNRTYPMENSISCADTLLHDFITWLKEQPFYENTTIVIVGDHLGHEEEFVNSLSPQEDRRIFNLILNAKSPETAGKTYNRDFWAGDLYPTVLSALGVGIEGNQLGLGINLFSDKPSLLESYGIETLTQELSENDSYYTKTFLMP